MTVTPTELRADLYRLLDKVIASGEPLLVRRGDSTVRIALVAAAAEPVLPPALRPDLIVGDPDALVRNDWLAGWAAGRDL